MHVYSRRKELRHERLREGTTRSRRITSKWSAVTTTLTLMTVLSLVAAFVGATNAGAAACDVRVIPADGAPDWKQPLDELHRRLEGGAASDRDCREVLVDVSNRPARVTVITTDGRAATRPLDRPRELAAVVSALVVTVPREEPTPVDLAAPGPVVIADTHVRGGSRRELALEFAGGVHVAGPGALTAPMVAAAARTLLGSWELALAGTWDVRWSTSGKTPADLSMSGGEASLLAGRRAVVGPLDLAGGLGVAVGYIRQRGTVIDVQAQGDMRDNTDVVAGSRLDLRLGAYLGVVFPARWRARLRPQIAAELVPGRVGRQESLDPALPELPSWAVTFALALETRLL